MLYRAHCIDINRFGEVQFNYTISLATHVAHFSLSVVAQIARSPFYTPFRFSLTSKTFVATPPRELCLDFAEAQRNSSSFSKSPHSTRSIVECTWCLSTLSCLSPVRATREWAKWRESESRKSGIPHPRAAELCALIPLG